MQCFYLIFLRHLHVLSQKKCAPVYLSLSVSALFYFFYLITQWIIFLQVHHDLSWAKTSPLPLAVLVRKNAGVDDEKKTEVPKIEADTKAAEEKTSSKPQSKPPTLTIRDGKQIANLVMFKQFCLEVRWFFIAAALKQARKCVCMRKQKSVFVG